MVAAVGVDRAALRRPQRSGAGAHGGASCATSARPAASCQPARPRSACRPGSWLCCRWASPVSSSWPTTICSWDCGRTRWARMLATAVAMQVGGSIGCTAWPNPSDGGEDASAGIPEPDPGAGHGADPWWPSPCWSWASAWCVACAARAAAARLSTRRWPLAADGPRRPSPSRAAWPPRLARRIPSAKRLTEGRLAEALMASEDRKLVDMAGYANPVAARSRFVAARFVLAILLPIAAVALDLEKNLIDSSVGVLIAAFLGFAVGYMLPNLRAPAAGAPAAAGGRRIAAADRPAAPAAGVGRPSTRACRCWSGIRPGAAGAVL